MTPLEELKGKLVALAEQYKTIKAAKIAEFKTEILAQQQQQLATIQQLVNPQPAIAKSTPQKTSAEPTQTPPPTTEETEKTVVEKEKTREEVVMETTQDVVGGVINMVYRGDKITDDNEENDEDELGFSGRVSADGNIKAEYEKELAEDLAFKAEFDSAKGLAAMELNKEFKIGAKNLLPLEIHAGIFAFGLKLGFELKGHLKAKTEFEFNRDTKAGSLEIEGGLTGTGKASLFVSALELIQVTGSASLIAEAVAGGKVAVKNNKPHLSVHAGIKLKGVFAFKIGISDWVQDIIDYCGGDKLYKEWKTDEMLIAEHEYKNTIVGEGKTGGKFQSALIDLEKTLTWVKMQIEHIQKTIEYVNSVTLNIMDFANYCSQQLTDWALEAYVPAYAKFEAVMRARYEEILRKAIKAFSRDAKFMGELSKVSDVANRQRIMMMFIKGHPLVEEATKALYSGNFEALQNAENKLSAVITSFSIKANKTSYIFGEEIEATITAQADKAFKDSKLSVFLFSDKNMADGKQLFVNLNAGTNTLKVKLKVPSNFPAKSSWKVAALFDAQMNTNDKLVGVAISVKEK